MRGLALSRREQRASSCRPSPLQATPAGHWMFSHCQLRRTRLAPCCPLQRPFQFCAAWRPWIPADADGPRCKVWPVAGRQEEEIGLQPVGLFTCPPCRALVTLDSLLSRTGQAGSLLLSQPLSLIHPSPTPCCGPRPGRRVLGLPTDTAALLLACCPCRPRQPPPVCARVPSLCLDLGSPLPCLSPPPPEPRPQGCAPWACPLGGPVPPFQGGIVPTV